MLFHLPLAIIRLFAIYFFMKAVAYIPATVVDVMGNVPDTIIRLQVLVVVLNLFVSVLVFSYPRAILIGLPRQRGEIDQDRSQVSRFQSAGIATIGLYFGFLGLHDLVYYHIFLANMSDHGLGSQPLSPQDTAGYWAAAFELVAGLALIAFSGGIASLFAKLRRLSPTIEVDQAEK
ncbi:hypothetical protein [Roseibium sp. M-1]